MKLLIKLFALACCIFSTVACNPDPPLLNLTTTVASTTTTTVIPDTDITVQEIIATFTSDINVSTTGSDSSGDGSIGNPFLTVGHAVAQSSTGNVIKVGAGTFIETASIEVPLGVSIEGAGIDITIIKAANLPSPIYINQTAPDFKEQPYGSLFQLVSPVYSTGALYGPPDQIVAPLNGNQKLSGFTLDGDAKKCKAGIWAQGRSNLSIRDLKFVSFKQRGLVVTRGNMHYYVNLPEGKWVRNVILDNLNFYNCSADLADESTGNLSIGGINGAEITNIFIRDTVGYGIKFIHVGHYRNVLIDNCDIIVPEIDTNWSEDIAIELWNLSYGNVVSNIKCNTWMSFVTQNNTYLPTTERPSNLKVYNVTMKDLNGSSTKESIEIMMSGVEIYNCYFQDKGFGIAFWGAGSHQNLIRDITIRNCVFANVIRVPSTASFGKSAAVFVPDNATNIKVYNNVFDKLGHPIYLINSSISTVSISNNIYLNPLANDYIQGTNINYTNNLRNDAALNTSGATASGNIGSTNPVLNLTGTRSGNFGMTAADTYYQAASVASPIVNAGVDVGLPYSGSAPDIGTFEWVE